VGNLGGCGSQRPGYRRCNAPEERVTILEALRLYTLNGAYAGFEENKKGSLAPGKLADFIVVDRDL